MANIRVPTKEMLKDLSQMGDQEFMSKWKTSRQYPIRWRRRLGLKSFNNQHGTVEHKIENGIEYKWCQFGHWEVISEFGIHSSRWDKLRGHCKAHANESARRSKNNASKTPEGKNRIRIQNGKRQNCYVLWEHSDELRAFELYENRCGYCGTKINYNTVEFDHIVPISAEGKTVPENMIPSCVECNRGVNGKKARDVMEWLYSKFGKSRGNWIYRDIARKQSIIHTETKRRVEKALAEIRSIENS